jgi:MoaA/NifB/PqqE/SkfB family radical SAM enzyme
MKESAIRHPATSPLPIRGLSANGIPNAFIESWDDPRRMMKTPRFAHLVLKPTLACTANCRTCSTRKTLHQTKIREDQLDIDDWRKLFPEMYELGMSKLTISGGEPTLYKDLIALVAEGKKYGWEIGINTNGSLIDQEYAMRLKDAGLGAVTLSLYGPEPQFHDRIRCHTGLWQKALQAARIFVEIREKHDPAFRVNMQTLLCKDNFRQFPDLIRLAYTLRFSSITFSYLEGDFKEKAFLLDENEIEEFREEIIPETVQRIEKSAADKWAKRMAVSAVESIFPEGGVTSRDYASGIYRPPTPCSIPSFFSIVLANGDVHPCNMVEYAHYPVVGNLHEKTFSEIWRGPEWTGFRKSGFHLCRYCPVPEQVTIPIERRPEFAGLQLLLGRQPLRSLRLPAKRMLFSRRRLLKVVRARRP